MTKALFELVVLVIRTFRVDLGHADFLFTWRKVAEGGYEDSINVDLESDDEEDRWHSRDPDEGLEALLKANGKDHEGLHENHAEEQSVDDYVPHTL